MRGFCLWALFRPVLRGSFHSQCDRTMGKPCPDGLGRKIEALPPWRRAEVLELTATLRDLVRRQWQVSSRLLDIEQAYFGEQVGAADHLRRQAAVAAGLHAVVASHRKRGRSPLPEPPRCRAQARMLALRQRLSVLQQKPVQPEHPPPSHLQSLSSKSPLDVGQERKLQPEQQSSQ